MGYADKALDTLTANAEERGYKRGVKDAAQLIEDRFHEFGIGWHAAMAILDLLEDPAEEQTNATD
jgi:hypothetical protein